jgi:rubrerythrin
VGQQRQYEKGTNDGATVAAVPVDRASHIVCAKCQGSAGRAARTRSVTRVDKDVHYLAYLWRCSVCGHEWEDDALRDLNAAAAEQARAQPTAI